MHNQIPLIVHIIRNNTTVTQLLLQAMRRIPSSMLIANAQLPFYHVKSLDMLKALIKYGAFCATIPQNQRIYFDGITSHRQAFWSCMNTQPNINIYDKSNETLLHYAAKENRYNIAEMLLKKNINIYAQSVIGQTALHIAAYRKHPEFMALLLSYAIHLEIQGTPHAKTLLLEEKNIDGSTALMIAVMENKTEIAHHLIDTGADIYTRNKYGHTLLHFVKDHILAQKLIDFGLDVDSQGIYGHTPLHFARNAEIAQLLIGNEANIYAQTVDGKKPLHLAKTAAIANILIDSGASVNNQDSTGKTLLHYAVVRNNVDICKLLLVSGACTKIKDNEGKTAIDCIECNASNGLFVLEDLEVLFGIRDRIPSWFKLHTAKFSADTSYIKKV